MFHCSTKRSPFQIFYLFCAGSLLLLDSHLRKRFSWTCLLLEVFEISLAADSSPETVLEPDLRLMPPV